MTNARAAMDAHWERWLDEHLRPYHYPTMVQLADHLEIGHEMDHDMAYKSDRDALVPLHRIAHGAGGSEVTTARDEAHTCHADGCNVHVPPKLFMCKRHWYMVPYGLRVAVWAAYQPGQEKLDGTAFPTDEYLEVTREAIEAVAAKERGRTSEGAE